jgi:hypothetical protein
MKVNPNNIKKKENRESLGWEIEPESQICLPIHNDRIVVSGSDF